MIIDVASRKRINVESLLLVMNAIFWLYFFCYFVVEAKREDPQLCMDHCHPAYAFWGHGIGYIMYPLSFTFMKTMIVVEYPSFALATYFENLITPVSSQVILIGSRSSYPWEWFPLNLSGGRVFLGISLDGYKLLLVVLLSFLQWWFVAKVMRFGMKAITSALRRGRAEGR